MKFCLSVVDIVSQSFRNFNKKLTLGRQFLILERDNMKYCLFIKDIATRKSRPFD